MIFGCPNIERSGRFHVAMWLWIEILYLGEGPKMNGKGCFVVATPPLSNGMVELVCGPSSNGIQCCRLVPSPRSHGWSYMLSRCCCSSLSGHETSSASSTYCSQETTSDSCASCARRPCQQLRSPQLSKVLSVQLSGLVLIITKAQVQIASS